MGKLGFDKVERLFVLWEKTMSSKMVLENVATHMKKKKFNILYLTSCAKLSKKQITNLKLILLEGKIGKHFVILDEAKLSVF